MNSIKSKEYEIVHEFQALPDVDSKYAHLFLLGESLPDFDPAYRNEDHLVKGCQSKLWFHLSQEEGKFHLTADSNSMVIKGIAALLVRLIEGSSVEEIMDLSLDFVDEMSIWKLASSRNNGLMAMLDHIKQAAQAELSGTYEGVKGSK